VLVLLQELEKRTEYESRVATLQRLTHREVQIVDNGLADAIFLLLKSWQQHPHTQLFQKLLERVFVHMLHELFALTGLHDHRGKRLGKAELDVLKRAFESIVEGVLVGIEEAVGGVLDSGFFLLSNVENQRVQLHQRIKSLAILQIIYNLVDLIDLFSLLLRHVSQPIILILISLQTHDSLAE